MYGSPSLDHDCCRLRPGELILLLLPRVCVQACAEALAAAGVPPHEVMGAAGRQQSRRGRAAAAATADEGESEEEEREGGGELPGSDEDEGSDDSQAGSSSADDDDGAPAAGKARTGPKRRLLAGPAAAYSHLLLDELRAACTELGVRPRSQKKQVRQLGLGTVVSSVGAAVRADAVGLGPAAVSRPAGVQPQHSSGSRAY
jgi:hypothetical protein